MQAHNQSSAPPVDSGVVEWLNIDQKGAERCQQGGISTTESLKKSLMKPKPDRIVYEEMLMLDIIYRLNLVL